jgi:hypothetical protein
MCSGAVHFSMCARALPCSLIGVPPPSEWPHDAVVPRNNFTPPLFAPPALPDASPAHVRHTLAAYIGAQLQVNTL